MTGLGVGRPEDVTARVKGLDDAIEDAADVGLESASGSSGISGSGFLVFTIGSAGSGPEGGAEGGGFRCNGLCGRAEVIVAVIVADI